MGSWRWYLLLVGAIGVVLVSCVLWFRTEMREPLPTHSDPAIIASNELYEDLCENKMGVTVHRKVTGVDGYLRHSERLFFNGEDQPPTDVARGGCTAVCLQQMLEQNFSYVEAPYNASRERSGIFFNELATATGKFRYHLIDRPDSKCQRFDRLMESNGSYQRRFAGFSDLLSQKCIVAEEVEQFSAAYEMRMDTLRVAEPEYLGAKGFIDEVRRSVLERKSGEVLAMQRTFMTGIPNFRNSLAAHCAVSNEDWLEIGHVLDGSPNIRGNGDRD